MAMRNVLRMLVVAFAIFLAGAERVSRAAKESGAANHTAEIQSHSSLNEYHYCPDKQVCCAQTYTSLHMQKSRSARVTVHYCEKTWRCHKQRHEFFNIDEVTYQGSDNGRHAFLKNNLCDAKSEVSLKHQEICKVPGDVCCVNENEGPAKKTFVCKAVGNCVPTGEQKLRIAEGNELTEDGQCPTATPRKKTKQVATSSPAPEGPTAAPEPEPSEPSKPSKPACSDGQPVCCRKEGELRNVSFGAGTRDSDVYICRAECNNGETKAPESNCEAQMACQDRGLGSKKFPTICCGTRKNSTDPEGTFGCWRERSCRFSRYEIAETEEEMRACLS